MSFEAKGKPLIDKQLNERRFQIQKPETDKQEDELSSHLPIAEKIPETDELIIRLFQQEFSNKIMQDQLTRQSSAAPTHALNDAVQDKLVPSVNSVPLNFNTKSNYVNFLQDKIVELHRLRLKDGNLTFLEENNQLRTQLESIKAEYFQVIKKYADLKRQTVERRKQIEQMDEMRSQGRQMRQALLMFHFNNSIPVEMMTALEVEKHNPLFDNDKIDSMIKRLQSEFESKGRHSAPTVNQKELEAAKAMREKMQEIADLQAKVRSLYLEQDRMKEQLKGKGLSQKQVDQQIAAVRAQLTEQMNAASEEATRRVEEMSKKLKLAESNRLKEGSKLTQVKRDFGLQLSELERQNTSLARERDKFRVDFEAADQRAKKVQEKLDKSVQEQKQMYSKMMNLTQQRSDSEREEVVGFIATAKSALKVNGPGQPIAVEIEDRVIEAIEGELRKSDDLAQKIVLLNENKAALEKQNQRLNSDFDELNNKLADGQQRMMELQNTVEELRKNEGALKRQISLLNESIAEEKLRGEALKSQIEAKEDRLALKDQEVTKLNTLLSEALETNKRQLAELEAEEGKLTEAKTKVTNLELDLVQKNEEMAKFDRLLEEEKQKFRDHLEREKEALSRRLDNVDSEMITDIPLLNGLIKEMKPALDRALDENKLIGDELKELQPNYEQKSRLLDKAVADVLEARVNSVAVKEEAESRVLKMKEKLRKFKEKVKSGELVEGTVVKLTKEKSLKLERAILEAEKELKVQAANYLKSEALVADLQNKVLLLTRDQLNDRRELEELRKFKADNEELLGRNQDLAEMKTRSFELKEKCSKLETANEGLLGQNRLLKEKLDSNEAIISDFDRLREEQLEAVKVANELAAQKTADCERTTAELKAVQEKLEFQVQQAEAEHEEFVQMKLEVEGLRDKVYELTKLDPRLTIQTRLYENEIQKLSLTNEQLQNEISRLKGEVKVHERNEKGLAAKIEELTTADSAQLLAKISERDIQIMEMVKMTNAKQTALEAALARDTETRQTNIQLTQRVALLQESLRVMRENTKQIEETNSAFLVNLRNEFGVSKEDEYRFSELKILYGKLEEQRDKIAYLSKNDQNSITRNPIYMKKVVELDLKDKELKIKSDNLLVVEKKAERLAADLRKAESVLREARLETERERDRTETAHNRIGEMNFEVTQLRQNLERRSEEGKALEARLKTKEREIEDMSEMVRSLGLRLGTAKAELLAEQQKATSAVSLERQMRAELEAVKAENTELQEAIITNTEGFLSRLSEFQERLDEAELTAVQADNKANRLSEENDELRRRLEAEAAKADGLNYKLDYVTKMNEKYSRLLKLPSDFAEKLTNYEDFIERFNELQDESAMKQKQIESLEAKLDEIYAKNPAWAEQQQQEEVFAGEALSSQISDEEQRPIKLPNPHRFATTNRELGVGNMFNEGPEKRALALAKKVEILENENKILKQNLNNYVEKTKNLGDSSTIRVKDFMTSMQVNQDDLKVELAARNRKIESLHQTNARLLEDYRNLKELIDKKDKKLKRVIEENRRVNKERVRVLNELQSIKEKDNFANIVKEANVSAANMAVVRMLEEKDRAYKEIIGIYEEGNKVLLSEKAEVSDADQLILKLTDDLKEAREALDKTEMKYQAVLAASKSATVQVENQRLFLVRVQKELEESQGLLSQERARLARAEGEQAEQALRFKMMENQIASLNDKIENEKQIGEALREELALYQQAEEEEEQLEKEGAQREASQPQSKDQVDKLFRKLDMKEKEIYRLKLQMKEHSSCTARLMEQTRILASNEVELKRIHVENARLGTEVTNAIAKRDQIQSELQDKENQVVILKDQLLVLTANLKNQTESVSALQNNNKKLRENMRDLVISFGAKSAEERELIDELTKEMFNLRQLVAKSQTRMLDKQTAVNSSATN